MSEVNFDRFLKHLMGHTVLVRLKNGKILSGIFHQLNKEEKFFSIVLKMCREKDDIMTYPREEEVIKSTDFLELKLDQLHLSINQGTFLTDTEISNSKNEKGGPRVLQPYRIDESIPMDEIVKPLDDDEELNWNQFDKRESTYTEELYTTKVDRNSKAYLDNVEKYSELEAKLLMEQTDNPHVAEERGQGFEDGFGDDERFSTVQRNQQTKKKNVNNNYEDDQYQEMQDENVKPSNTENNNLSKKEPKNKIPRPTVPLIPFQEKPQDKKILQSELTKFSKDIEAKVTEKKKKKRKIKFNINAQEFKPKSQITLPPVSPLHPPERRPAPIDINIKVSSIFHKKIATLTTPPAEAGNDWPSNKQNSWNEYETDVPYMIETKKEQVQYIPPNPYPPPFYNPRVMPVDQYGVYPEVYNFNPYPPYTTFVPPFGVYQNVMPPNGKRNEDS